MASFRPPRHFLYHQSLPPCLIGIAGPSCAGKSELAGRLASVLGAPILPLDCYYRDLSHLSPEQRAAVNFDVPEALDEELLARDVALLASGASVERPLYDFTRHVRLPQREPLRPGRFLIIEGLFALYWEAVRERLSLKLFVDAPDAVCFQRRLERDVRERGRTPESVRRQYEQSVRPMAERYILPTRRFADLVLAGTDPPERWLAAVLERIQQGCGRTPSPPPAAD